MRKLIIALALALSPTLVHAATMQVEQHESETRLMIEGDMNVGDGNRFLARVANLRPTQLGMNSPGGDADSGMLIARWVHENRDVEVFVNDYCNSACSYAALVALGRGDLTVDAASSLGVHQVSDVYDDRPGKANVGWTKRAADTLRGYGAPEEPLVAMVATPPKGIVAFDAAALEKMGATVARAALPDLLPDLPKIPMPDLPAAPNATGPFGIATLAILILLLFGLTLGFRRLATATNKEHTMKFNKQMRRDLARGYEVNYTTLKIAYVIEIAIILAAFYASYEFANRYVSDEWTLWIMAIIGGACVALAESARIFLAKNVRTQTSLGWKLMAALGLVFMCVVTTKALSQVMEQTYSPRLRQVQEASDDLKIAEAELNARVTERDVAVNPLEQAEADVKEAEANVQRLNDLITQQGAAPADREIPVGYKATCYNQRKRPYTCWKQRVRFEKVSWAGQQFADQIPAAIAKRDELVSKRDAAQVAVTALDAKVVSQEKMIAKARSRERDAVGMSQLHSFTAMVYGKDPIEVTDAEVHWFLRFFILIPSIMIASASSILAMVSYTRIESRRVEFRISDEANTLTTHIDRAIAKRVEMTRKRKPKSTPVEPEPLRHPSQRAFNSNS